MKTKVNNAIKTAREIWRWEWNHDGRGRLFTLSVEALVALMILVFYKVNKGIFFRATGIVMKTPAWFYGLLGLNSSVETGNISFYLSLALMVMNGWNVWFFCRNMAWSVNRDEVSGSVFVICNQWKTRRQLAWGRASWNVVALILQQTILYIWILFLSLLASVNGFQRKAFWERFAASWLRSSCVMLLLMAIVFLHVSFHRRRKNMYDGSFRALLYWLPLSLGNLFRLRDAIFGILEILEKPVPEKLTSKLGWMEGLYWVSPLSWMNPFARGWSMIQYLACLTLSVGAVWFGAYRYQKREFFS